MTLNQHLERARALRAQINNPSGPVSESKRPPGMHRKTYFETCALIRAHEAAARSLIRALANH